MGFSTAQGSTVHVQGMLEIENFVPCDMSLWSNGGANNPDNQSSIAFESAKAPRASELTRKRKVARNPTFQSSYTCTFWSHSCFFCIFVSFF